MPAYSDGRQKGGGEDMKRRPMSRKESKRKFSKGNRINKRNIVAINRGGYRL